MTKPTTDTMSAAARADAERRRSVLRQLLKRHNMRPAELARRAGLPTTNALYNFLNGHSRSLSQATIEKIVALFPDGSADGLIIRPVASSITMPHNRQAPPGIVVVPVIAEARLGVSQPTLGLAPKDQLALWIPTKLVGNRQRLFGVRVGRPGGEELYSAGTVLICIAVSMRHPDWLNGQRVVVTEPRDSGIEVSVRRVQVHESGIWLWPDTEDPRHQRPLLAPQAMDPAANHDVAIVGRVIATLQPEPSFDD
jgi:hypothetical protein